MLMKTKSLTTVTGLIVCCGLPLYISTASAEFSGTLRFTTDYVARGYSKSDGQPTVQGNLDYEHDSGFFTGAWLAMVNFSDKQFTDRANLEAAPYLGWNFPLNDDWRIDTTVSRYFYDGKLFGKKSDYNELNVAINFRDLLTARIAWSENYYNRNNVALDYELTARYPLTDSLEISAGVGFTDALKALQYNYLYWNAGVSWFFKYGSMDLRYVQANEYGDVDPVLFPQHFAPQVINGEAVFSLSLGF